MAEREKRRDLLGIIVPISDKDPLTIGNCVVPTREIEETGSVLDLYRERFGELAAGANCTP